MRFRPCIDIHNGKVKQIVGGSLQDQGDQAQENYVAEQDAPFFARLYQSRGIRGGHIILLNPATSPYYGTCSRKGTSGSGSELSEKRRTILYRDRPLAEIYTGTRIGTDD